MMPIFQTLQDSLLSWTGSTVILALAIILFFVVAFLWVGIDFHYVLSIVAVLGLTFASVGWFPVWISALIWVVVVGFSIYFFWSWFMER